MILTENRKGQIESEVEIEGLIGPGMWTIEVPGLAKDVQPMVTIQDPQEMAAAHCRGYESQNTRSEIGKGNHQADQEAKKAAHIPQEVLKVLGLIEEMPQPGYTKEENWAKNRGLISLRG